MGTSLNKGSICMIKSSNLKLNWIQSGLFFFPDEAFSIICEKHNLRPLDFFGNTVIINLEPNQQMTDITGTPDNKTL